MQQRAHIVIVLFLMRVIPWTTTFSLTFYKMASVQAKNGKNTPSLNMPQSKFAVKSCLVHSKCQRFYIVGELDAKGRLKKTSHFRSFECMRPSIPQDSVSDQEFHLSFFV